MFTLPELHIEVDSKYQAIQEGTNGCNQLQNDHHYKPKDDHLSLAEKVLLCRVGKLFFSLNSVLSSKQEKLKVLLLGMLNLLAALAPHSNFLKPNSIPYPCIHMIFIMLLNLR